MGIRHCTVYLIIIIKQIDVCRPTQLNMTEAKYIWDSEIWRLPYHVCSKNLSKFLNYFRKRDLLSDPVAFCHSVVQGKFTSVRPPILMRGFLKLFREG